MRILHLCPHFPPPVAGGMEKQAYLLVRALVAQGVDCDVLALTFDKPGKHQNSENFSVVRLKKLKVPVIEQVVLAVRIALFLVVKRYDYDIVHSHTFSWLGLWVGFVARKLGIKTVTKMPNVGDHGVPGLKARWFGGIQASLLTKSDAIVCLSKESVDELTAIGYQERRIYLTVNGVVVPDARNRKERKLDSSICFGFAGRLVDQKNIPNLFKAFSKLPDVIAGKDVRLVLAGDGPLRQELGQLAVELGVESRLEFLGHVANMEDFFSRIDIFVLPSLAEGNSNALLEAMAQGVPALTTDVGGSARLLAPVFDQLQIPLDDPDGMTNRMETLAKDPMLRAEISHQLYTRAKKLFSIDIVSRHYSAFYFQLCNKSDTEDFEVHRVFK